MEPNIHVSGCEHYRIAFWISTSIPFLLLICVPSKCLLYGLIESIDFCIYSFTCVIIFTAAGTKPWPPSCFCREGSSGSCDSHKNPYTPVLLHLPFNDPRSILRNKQKYWVSQLLLEASALESPVLLMNLMPPHLLITRMTHPFVFFVPLSHLIRENSVNLIF